MQDHWTRASGGRGTAGCNLQRMFWGCVYVKTASCMLCFPVLRICWTIFTVFFSAFQLGRSVYHEPPVACCSFLAKGWLHVLVQNGYRDQILKSIVLEQSLFLFQFCFVKLFFSKPYYFYKMHNLGVFFSVALEWKLSFTLLLSHHLFTFA